MASLFEPVGPLDRRVYWRRRALVIGVLVVILLVLFRACSGDDSPDADPSAATASPSASATSKATSSGSATPKASASASATATKTATAVPTCKNSDILVTARPSKSSYAVGDTVNITYVVETKNDVKCKRDVGGAADEVRVVASNGQIVWSSDYCSPGGEKDVRTLGPTTTFSVLVAWDGDVTAASCPDDRLPAPAGVYQVLGRNGTVVGPSAKLTLG